MTTKLNILLVLSPDQDRAQLTAELSADGRFDVHSTSDLHSARLALTQLKIDVVLLSLNLNDCQGQQVVEQIQDTAPETAIVVLTEEDEQASVESLLNAGAQDSVPRSDGEINVLSRSLLYAHERNERQVIQKRQEAVDSNLAVARTIQQHLLAPRNPDIPGFDVAAFYRPVEACGGDFYDIIDHGDAWDLIIADVCGHGFAPALIMTQTQSLLRALAKQLGDVGEVVSAVNQELCRDIPDEHFVSMFYARLNPKTRELSYTIAGHPAMIFRAGGAIDLLNQGEAVLGIDPEANYPVHGTTLLSQGDRLVLMTDGIQEVASREGELFGHDRFTESLISDRSTDCQQAVRNVINAAIRFAAPGEVQDDITMMMLKCLGEPG